MFSFAGGIMGSAQSAVASQIYVPSFLDTILYDIVLCYKNAFVCLLISILPIK